MLKPSVQIHNVDGILIAEFWDCLRLDPAAGTRLATALWRMFRSGVGPNWSSTSVGWALRAPPRWGTSWHCIALSGKMAAGSSSRTWTRRWPRYSASKLEALFEFVPDRTTGLKAIIEHPGASHGEGARPLEKDPKGPLNPSRGGLSRLRRRSPESGGKAEG